MRGQFGVLTRMRDFVESGLLESVGDVALRYVERFGDQANLIVGELGKKSHNWRRPTPLVPASPWPRIVFSREGVTREARLPGVSVGESRSMVIEFQVVIGDLDIVTSGGLPSLDGTAYDAGLLISEGLEYLFEKNNVLLGVLGESDLILERTNLLAVSKTFELETTF